jgi:hypothetical protein
VRVLFADLVLGDRVGQVKLRISGALLRQAAASLRADHPVCQQLQRLTQAQGALSLRFEEVEWLADELAAACEALSPALEEGALVWSSPRQTGALSRKTLAESAGEDEEGAQEVGLLKSPAVLALALRRGLMITHRMDRWWARREERGEEEDERSDAE